MSKQRKPSKKSVTTKIILCCLLAVFVGTAGFSAYKIITIMKDYQEGEKEYQGIADMAIKNTETIPDFPVREDESPYLNIDYDVLYSKNSDYVGWIYIADSQVNYPIMYSKDNMNYSHASFEQTYLYAGSIFMDYRNSMDMSDFVTVIYGHHMKNGSMFGQISRYKDVDWLEGHPYIEIYLKDKIYIYRVFSFHQTKATSDVYTFRYGNDAEKREHINMLKQHSWYDIPVDVTPNDKIITLSTCVKAEGLDRWVLHAVLNEVVDLSEINNH